MTGHRMSSRAAQDWIGTGLTGDCVRGGLGAFGLSDNLRARINLAVAKARSTRTREEGRHQ